MPISPPQLAALEDAANRLSAEALLAQPGRDDGLVPAYSLLAGVHELCAPEPLLRSAVAEVQVELERLLDAAQPFDTGSLAKLRALVDWLPLAIVALRHGGTPPPAGTRRPPAGEAPPCDPEADTLLVLNLEENRELLAEFHAETVDHLQQIEGALLALDQEPDNPEALHSIFRSFHTIKGNAGFLGLEPMRTLAHEVESLLDLARNGKLRLNAAIITEVLHSRDALQAMAQQVALGLAKGQRPAEIIPIRPLIRTMQQLVAVQTEPAAQAGFELPVPGLACGAAEPMPEAVNGPLADRPALPAAGDDAPATAVGQATPSSAPVPRAAKSATPTAARLPGSASVRVSTEKLDSLMDVVGELVIVQSQLLESARFDGNVREQHQRNLAQLGRITKELQSTAMSLRMIPIRPTFQKMERLARDLARDLGKKVAFATTGDETELDRTVVEEMADPLVHMVRNALDHGLEVPADRAAAGKPETGTLHLKAYHQGSSIVVEVQDDGRGINPETVYRKATERGLVAPGTPLTPDEILELIFMPGFSTAETITPVSGRGVGMDVVKRNIEKLRGKIEIVSEIGRGTTFKLKLPLTLAIIDGLVVRVGEDRFILPSTSVQMALRPDRDHVTRVHGKGEVLELRGRYVPIQRLHQRFGILGEARDPWEGIAVIVETSGRLSALLVDEMLSKQEVVIKNLGGYLQNLPGVAGGAILGDGAIALILDPASFLNAA